MKLKVRLLKNKGFLFTINKRYKPLKTIVPIGCDCHPAYMLKTLNLREQSLPFDWLDTKPKYGLKYVYENINNSFIFFLTDLKKNDENKVFSNKFNYSTFYHFDDLVTNDELKLKIKKRIKLFLSIIKNKPIYFINTVTSESLNNVESVKFYYKSVQAYLNVLKKDDELIIYLRYDENFEENNFFCEDLIKKVNGIGNKVKIIKYLREMKKFGIWGDEKKYKPLIKNMGIKLYPTFPKIKITKI